MSEEEEFEFRLRRERERAASTPAPEPYKEPEPEPEGLLGRSMSRVGQAVTGFKEAFQEDINTPSIGYDDVMTGPSEGNSYPGARLLKRTLTGEDALPRQILQAGGGEIIPAVGDIMADAMITGGKAVLPPAAEEVIAKGARAGMNALQQSSPYKYAAEKWGGFEEENPLAAKDIKNTANIVSAVSPLKLPKGIRLPLEKTMNKSLAKTKNAYRAKDTARALKPDRLDAPSRGTMDEVRIGTTKFIPNELERRRLAEVGKVGKYDPNRSYAHQNKVLNERINEMKVELDAKLADAPPVQASQVNIVLDDAVKRAKEQPVLSGDAGSKADSILAELNYRLADVTDDATGTIKLNDLMQVRRDVDNWLNNSSSSGAFDGPTAAANAVAIQKVRGALNDLVAKSAPDVDVKDLLTRQSDLLSMTDRTSVRMFDEPNTKLGRIAEQIESESGVRHPRNPEGLKRTVADETLQKLAVPLAAGYVTAKKGPRVLPRAIGGTANLTAEALRRSPVIAGTTRLTEEKEEQP